jgi:hypothetical protein
MLIFLIFVLAIGIIIIHTWDLYNKLNLIYLLF